MHLIGSILVLLGAWMVLAVPVALLMGRFLRIGSETQVQTRVHRARRHPYGTAA